MKTKIINEIITSVIVFIVQFYNATSKYVVLHENRYLPFIGEKYSFAVWHQSIFKTVSYFFYEVHILMTSKSKDGELAALVAKKLNKIAARGSSSKGGREALNIMIDIINEQGIPGALTIDGPRGPIHEVKRGIVDVAVATNSPIIPLTAKSESFWTIHKSWDQMRIPKPFSKIYVNVGEPIFIDASKPDYITFYTSLIRDRLFELEAEIDRKIATK